MLLLSLIFGCDDHEFCGGKECDAETTGEGYAAVQSIFSNNSCTGCHATGAEFPPLDGNLCVFGRLLLGEISKKIWVSFSL